MSIVKRFNQFLNEDHDSGADHYMFFGNIETIKRACEEILAMDEAKVDELLSNGHDWAADHVATSKDDIEEVLGFLKNEMEGDAEGYTQPKYSEEELDQMTKNQMEHDEAMLRREQGI